VKTTIRSTDEQLTKLIEFRQTVYQQGLGQGRDALFELIDAVVERPLSQCLAELSLSPQFRRGWSSVYKAVEAGCVKTAALAQLFVAQVPLRGIQVYPLDSTMWAHPAARTLEGLVYAPSPTKALKRHSIVQGHEYSLLGWTAEVRQSWTPTLTVERVMATDNSVAVGVRQVQWLCQQRQRLGASALDVIVADGHYGNPGFFGPLRQARCAVLARLRCDRVLYGPPPAYAGRGRPRKHGARFAFKAPDTWSVPVESCEFVDERWGQVRLRRWDNLHDQQAVETTLSVICAEVQRTHAKPRAPLWLGYKPGHTDYPLRMVWAWFDQRWAIEPSIRFRKQSLAWTLPACQQSAVCDRWTWLTHTAFWYLYLARPLVADSHLPWQKPVAALTPARVKRAFPFLFAVLSTPALPPQTRGKAPGWPTGQPRRRPKRFKPLKRGPPNPK
jgi:hypothetical protein